MFAITHKDIEKLELGYEVEYLRVNSVGLIKKAEFLYDDGGDNIAGKNKKYSELTGHYFIHKNLNINIVGICHYRRIFFKSILPGWIDKKINITNLKKIKLDYESLSKRLLAKEIDIVLPKKRINLTKKGILSIYDHFVYHKGSKYLDLFLMVLKEYNEDFYHFYNNYIRKNNTGSYWNMMICRKDIFDKIMSFSFELLERTEEKIIILEGEIPDRLMGYFTESLIPAYCEYHKYNIEYRNVCFIKGI